MFELHRWPFFLNHETGEWYYPLRDIKPADRMWPEGIQAHIDQFPLIPEWEEV